MSVVELNCDQISITEEFTSDMEIVTSILSTVLAEEDACKIACELLTHFDDVFSILRSNDDELKRSANIPEVAIREIHRTRLLVQSIYKSTITNRPLLDDLDSVRRFCRVLLNGKKREEFHVLFLGNSYHLLAHECLQVGTIDHVSIYPRELMSRALFHNASHLILVHNHPDGKAVPSEQDIMTTSLMEKAGQLLNISILDHIIVGCDGDFSFRQMGLIKTK